MKVHTVGRSGELAHPVLIKVIVIFYGVVHIGSSQVNWLVTAAANLYSSSAA